MAGGLERGAAALDDAAPEHVRAAIDEHAVTLFDVYTMDEHTVQGVDTVVMITGRSAAEALATEMQPLGVPLQVIGDAKFPRDMRTATEEGHLLGRALNGRSDRSPTAIDREHRSGREPVRRVDQVQQRTRQLGERAAPAHGREALTQFRPSGLSKSRSVISVGNKPGAIALTRMPLRAHCAASSRVRFTRPPLLAA